MKLQIPQSQILPNSIILAKVLKIKTHKIILIQTLILKKIIFSLTQIKIKENLF
jgi:hypothetical protein